MAGNVRRQFTEESARLDDVQPEVGGQADSLDQIFRPSSSARIDEVRGGGVRIFANGVSCEPEVEEVGNGEKLLRGFQEGRRILRGGEQLVDRVDGHELYSGGHGDFYAGNFSADLFHAVRGARIAVVVRILEQLSFFAEEGIVHAPGIDS